ncbi:MAG: glucose-1-phosphate adenylyltransferase [Thermoanaerobaculia bacterium]|nr:glucose-1-phosphate adenylyltransferase [Thermoanaerobaculia bacterium]
MKGVVTAVLGGGQGTRLWPLTQYRAKPAVPVGGRFRLIDIPISNSLHAGIDQIYVITQFNSASLHRHISQTYRFDVFSPGFVNLLAAEQTVSHRDWYQGTADAVRRNLDRLDDTQPDDLLILSGDQLYLMDLEDFIGNHRRREADLTVAVKPVSKDEAQSFGIMRVDDEGRIVEFVEKPKDPEQIERLSLTTDQLSRLGFNAPGGSVLASMGIYVFRRGMVGRLLRGNDKTDFGQEVIPSAIEQFKVHAWGHSGYWQDIGTIPSFHRANLDLTLPLPPLNLYSSERPIYTHPRFLPGTKINRCEVLQSVLCEGSIISASSIRRSIVGIRALVQQGSVIENSIIMGATQFESAGAAGSPPIGVGKGCTIKNSIIDLNARIGDGAKLLNEANVQEADGDNYAIRGGIIVIAKDAVIEPGTVI